MGGQDLKIQGEDRLNLREGKRGHHLHILRRAGLDMLEMVLHLVKQRPEDPFHHQQPSLRAYQKAESKCRP